MRKLVQADSQTPKTTPMGIVLSSFRDGRRPTSSRSLPPRSAAACVATTIATAFYAVTTPRAGRLRRPDGATSRAFTRKTCVCSGARTRGAKRPCRSGTGSFVVPGNTGAAQVETDGPQNGTRRRAMRVMVLIQGDQLLLFAAAAVLTSLLVGSRSAS